MKNKPINEEKYQILLFLFDTDGTKNIHEFLSGSRIFYEVVNSYSSYESKFIIKSEPEVYRKYQNNLWHIENSISDKCFQAFGVRPDKIETKIDLDKFHFIENKIIIVQTPWEEINRLQKKLIDDFEHSFDSIDFQNLGNTARNIMSKLAKQVFVAEKHTPSNKKIDISESKFKNQLHSFIDFILKGDKNAEFRKLSEASIEVVERSIDFMNTTTHKSNAERHIGEVCVISTINAISLIKLINELS